jgi:hypothetical protein
MSDLINALRKKYRTPQDALQALGLDKGLLKMSDIGDSKPSFMENQMSKKALSTTAAMVKGAVMAHLGSKLAKDAMPDLNKLLSGVRFATFAKMKPNLAKGIVALAKDANLESVIELLDALEGDPGDNTEGVDEKDPDEDVQSKSAKKAAIAEGEDDGEEAMDDGGIAEVLASLKALIAKLEGGVDAEVKGEETEDEPPQSEGGVEADPKAGGNKKEIPGAKAMDKKNVMLMVKQACDAAAKLAEDKTITRLRSIAEAEEVVRPYVGKLTAMDSAEAVYKAALGILKVDVAGVPGAALKHILLAQPVPGARQPRIAQDTATVTSITDYFPDANRVA